MSNPIIDVFALANGPWPTLDPFLFCVHHDDRYPAGTEDMGPSASLAGRKIGQDFSGKDGWSLYHGARVPGFPQHPHRGFETVTIARHGFIDHADSLGASARFGEGDLQWMTAGSGVVHSEMFPLLQTGAGNHTELFQIWLNLPGRSKMAPPHFAMFWRDEIPMSAQSDADGREIVVTSYAKKTGAGSPPLLPPPNSWAASPANAVGIWTVKLSPGATWTLPAADPTCNRRLYLFQGDGIDLDGQALAVDQGATLDAGQALQIVNGSAASELLLLEGRPIGEPVAQYGPFVMTDRQGLQQAFDDYSRTQFGGWPWPEPGPAHPRAQGRFAQFPDGRRIQPKS